MENTLRQIRGLSDTGDEREHFHIIITIGDHPGLGRHFPELLGSAFGMRGTSVPIRVSYKPFVIGLALT